MGEIKDYNIIFYEELPKLGLIHRNSWFRDFDEVNGIFEYSHEILKSISKKFLGLINYTKKVPVARFVSEPRYMRDFYKKPNNLTFDGLKIQILDYSIKDKISNLVKKVEDIIKEEALIVCPNK